MSIEVQTNDYFEQLIVQFFKNKIVSNYLQMICGFKPINMAPPPNKGFYFLLYFEQQQIGGMGRQLWNF
jgi:hypothetical protein